MADHARSASTRNAANGLGEYLRHRPEDTILYDVVRAHLDPFLRAGREDESRSVPRYVEREFRKYIRCGVLANGFLRAYCSGCGADVLVAFSCKNRGVCPSCATRRMCAAAAQIADDVLPDRPLRQWVVTVPFELRMVLATRADAMREVLKIIVKEIERAYTRRAAARGGVKARFGGITFIHRFGGSLNLHVHFHVVVIDGAYDETAGEFSPAESPDAITLRKFLERVHSRVWKWAKRRAERYAKEGARDANGFEALGIQRGLFATLDERGRPVEREDDDAFDPQRMPGHADRYEGFSVHAGVTVAADDRAGRERLCRYGARPPFSLERMSVLHDGRIAYRTKYPGPYGHTHRVMTPVEFLARLAALIPPPRYPLIHYHGVLAPNSKLRSRVVPSTGHGRAKACRAAPSPARVSNDPIAAVTESQSPANDIISTAPAPPAAAREPCAEVPSVRTARCTASTGPNCSDESIASTRSPARGATAGSPSSPPSRSGTPSRRSSNTSANPRPGPRLRASSTRGRTTSSGGVWNGSA